eukprot:scaffold24585_cov102-Isochrysis_galbana.AAC.1
MAGCGGLRVDRRQVGGNPRVICCARAASGYAGATVHPLQSMEEPLQHGCDGEGQVLYQSRETRLHQLKASRPAPKGAPWLWRRRTGGGGRLGGRRRRRGCDLGRRSSSLGSCGVALRRGGGRSVVGRGGTSSAPRADPPAPPPLPLAPNSPPAASATPPGTSAESPTCERASSAK